MMKVLVALNLLTVACGSFFVRHSSKNFSFSSDLMTRRRKSSAKVLKKEAKVKTLEEDDFSAALEALYAGVDFPDEQLRLEDFNDAEPEHVERNVQVFGLQNSGTSLLKAFLYSNFGRRLNYFSDVAENNQEPNKRMGLYEHANLKEVFKQDDRSVKKIDDALVYTISVVRNPYTWLSSLREAGTASAEPLAECLEGEDWLTRPCIHQAPGGPKQSRIKEVPYQSLAGLWGHFTEGYIKAGEYGFQRNILVTYENLVADPCGVMDRVAEVMKVKKPTCAYPFDSASNTAREKFNRRISIDYLTMNMKEKQSACIHLDGDVLDYMHYKMYNCSSFSEEDSATTGLQAALLRELHKAENSAEKKVKKHKHEKQSIDLMRLFEGRDFAEDSLKLEDISDDGEDVAAERNIQIIGLEHSGVDLLKAILYANFGRRLNYYSDKATDLDTRNERLGVWSHANLQELSQADPSAPRIYHDQNVFMVAVVRNPFAWLQVMRKEWSSGDDRVMDPSLVGCVRGTDWLSRNCSHPYPGGRSSGSEEKMYGSLPGVWGKWTESYLRAAEHGFNRNLVITYESLTSYTSMTKFLDRLATYMEIEPPKNGWVYPLDSEDSRERKLADREARDQDIFLNQYNQMDKQRACTRLDQDVVKYMQYPVFDCTSFVGAPPAEAREVTHDEVETVGNESSPEASAAELPEISQDDVDANVTELQPTSDIVNLQRKPAPVETEIETEIEGLESA